MNWSVGEAGALALKAARGAGMTWGEAEEAGFAVKWLQQRGAPGIEILSDYLAAYEEQTDSHSPITIGTAISDLGIIPPADLGIVQSPALLIPFIAAISMSQPMRLSIGQIGVDIFDNGFRTDGEFVAIIVAQASCSLALGPSSAANNADPQQSLTARIPDTAAAAMERLGMLAHRTYAPSTEESRQSGAGADANVND